jgi:uncharacterized protein (UPF0332 family)
MNEEVRRYLERADRSLEASEVLAKAGFWAESASRIYYAMFYAAQALLKAEGTDVTKHSAVEAAFGYQFAKTGRIDPKFHRMLIDARKIREKADYDLFEEIVEPEASLEVKSGREFVAAIRALLAAL